MDGENNGKPYEQMDDLGGKPTIFGNIHLVKCKGHFCSYFRSQASSLAPLKPQVPVAQAKGRNANKCGLTFSRVGGWGWGDETYLANG